MPAEPTRIVLILGGARSGKSAYAERLATELGEPVLFVATATALDEEMRKRITAHQANRPRTWTTLEAPTALGSAIRARADEVRTILVDCFTLLVSNLLVRAGEGMERGAVEREVEQELVHLLGAASEMGANLVVVSNEVGLGLVPEYPLGRAYRDLLGHANQRLAAAATDVYFMAAGIPVVVKGRL